MRRVTVVGGLVAATVIVVGSQLSSSTLQATTGMLSLSATTGATQLANATALVNALIAEGSLTPVRVEQDPLLPGRSHERFAQYYGGLRVAGAEVTRQTRGSVVHSVFGTVHTEIVLDTTTTLTAVDAVRVIESLTGDPRIARADPTPLIVRSNDGIYRPAYQVRSFSTAGFLESYVDAQNGTVLHEAAVLRTQGAELPCGDCAVGTAFGVKGDRKKISVRSRQGGFHAEDALRPARILTYDMRGDWERTLAILLGEDTLNDSDQATDIDNQWEDGASVDAHVGTGWFYDYLAERFGRDGLNGQNGPISSLVHPIRRLDFFSVAGSISNLFHLNAFFCGFCGTDGLMVYGEGLPPGLVLAGTGQSVDFFSAGLDIVAHELGHGVTEFTSGLIYRDESGALNEALSDVVAVGHEFFMAETGRHPFEQPDYLIGEDVIRPGGIRSLADPMSRGDPDHYSRRFTGEADNGGVHTNSLIASHAFYLAVEGGVNRTSGRSVVGVGRENRPVVEQVFFRALTSLLPPDATFAMARAATIQAARDLSGSATSPLVTAVRSAWTAVGVE